MAYNENTDLVRGEYMMLYVKDGLTVKPIAFASNNGISISADTVDTSNKMSGRWKAFMSGQSGWTVSTEALISKVEGHLSYNKLKELMIAGKPIDVQFGYVDETSEEFELDTSKPSSKGQGFITSLELTSERGGIATCSINLQGSGPLENVAAV